MLTDTPTITQTPTITPSPTPNVYYTVTLASGQAGQVVYSITAGEVVNATLLLVIVGLLIFIVFILLARLK